MKRSAVHFASLAVCLVFGACASVGDVSSTVDPAMDRQDFEITKSTADGGDVVAQVALADMYRQGIGTPRDVGKAATLYRQPAERGDAIAQYNLGMAYFGGLGTAQNLPESALWFAKSAERGNPLAQYRLGSLYAKGLGVAQDLSVAYKWLTISESRLRAASGDSTWHDYKPEVMDALAKLPAIRDGVARRLRAPDMEQARQAAASWKPKN